MIIEIAANNYVSAYNAYQGGANRIELVSNLLEGGVTPTAGTLMQCIETIPIPTFPIIRPRGGDFLYSKSEIKSMCYDISQFKNIGCKGIVIGALSQDGTIDLAITKQLILEAGNMEITFHRAFDRTKNKELAMQQLIDLGCHRVLTSGQYTNAFDGRFSLQQLNLKFGKQMIIMPGAGVTAINALEITSIVQNIEIHSSMKDDALSNMLYFRENFEKETYVASSILKVKELVAVFK